MLNGNGCPYLFPVLVWSFGILAVAFPLGVFFYNRRTTQ
jgi:hypothetical protein